MRSVLAPILGIPLLMGCPPDDPDSTKTDALEARIAELEQRLADAEANIANGVVRTPTTLNVPADYADVNEALASLDGKHIATGVIVTIEIAEGTYTYASPIVLDHPDGDNIEIVGDTRSGATGVTLQFIADTSGVVVENGNVLGYLDRVRLQGTGTPSSAVGVEVRGNAYARLGPEVEVTAFGHHGYEASVGGVLRADGTAASDNQDHGYFSGTGGLLVAPDSTASGSQGGSGYLAEDASILLAQRADASGNAENGFGAVNMSLLDASGEEGDAASATENGRYGFVANNMSAVHAMEASSLENGLDGYRAEVMSDIRASNSTATSNGKYPEGTGTGSAWGYIAKYSSRIVSENSKAEDNNTSGFVAHHGSTIFAESSASLNNDAGYGFQSTFGSWIYAAGASSGIWSGSPAPNADGEFWAEYGSSIDATGASGAPTDPPAVTDTLAGTYIFR